MDCRVLCKKIISSLFIFFAATSYAVPQSEDEAYLKCHVLAYVRVPLEHESSCSKKSKTIFKTFERPVVSWSECRSWVKVEVLKATIFKKPCIQKQWGIGSARYIAYYKPEYVDVFLRDEHAATIESTKMPENVLVELWEDSKRP